MYTYLPAWPACLCNNERIVVVAYLYIYIVYLCVCDIIIYSPNVHRPPRTSSFTDDASTTTIYKWGCERVCVCDIRVIYCTYNNTVEYTYGDVARFGRHQRRRSYVPVLQPSQQTTTQRRRPTHATAKISSLINSDLYIIMIKKFIIRIHFNNICSAALTGTVVVYNIIIVVAMVVCAEFVFGNVAAGRVRLSRTTHATAATCRQNKIQTIILLL